MSTLKSYNPYWDPQKGVLISGNPHVDMFMNVFPKVPSKKPQIDSEVWIYRCMYV